MTFAFSDIRIEPLQKEVAYPGQFIDAFGQQVDLTPELLSKALKDTQLLQQHGFRIAAYTSHFTVDSADCVGYWPKLFQDDKSHLHAVLEPVSEEMRKLAMPLDTSMVLEEGVEMGTKDGVIKVDMAITRIDVVPQGAVVGTEKFRELQTAFSQGKRPIKSEKTFLFGYGAKETKNMDEKKTDNDENEVEINLSASLSEMLGLPTNLPDKNTVIKDKVKRLMEGDVTTNGNPEKKDSKKNLAYDDEETKDGDTALMKGKKGSDMMKECKGTSGLSQPQSELHERINELENDKFETLFSANSVPEGDEKTIRASFLALREKAGFQLAFGVASDTVAIASRNATPTSPSAPTTALSAGVRVAKRPDQGKGKADPIALAKKSPTLLAADKMFGSMARQADAEGK